MGDLTLKQKMAALDEAIEYHMDHSRPVPLCPVCCAPIDVFEVGGIGIWVACPEGHIKSHVKLAQRPDDR